MVNSSSFYSTIFDNGKNLEACQASVGLSTSCIASNNGMASKYTRSTKQNSEFEWHSSQQQLCLLQRDKNNLQTKRLNSEMKVCQLTGDLWHQEEIFEKEMLSRCELLQHKLYENYRTIEDSCTNLKVELLSKEKKMQEYQMLCEQIKQQNQNLVRKLADVEKEKEGVQTQYDEAQSCLNEMKLELDSHIVKVEK